jgi:hypothetical protein
MKCGDGGSVGHCVNEKGRSSAELVFARGPRSNYQLLELVYILIGSVNSIDLVLIDPQSVGKRTPDLMDTVNAKKRWKTICWRVNKYLKKSHLLTRFGKERASF